MGTLGPRFRLAARPLAPRAVPAALAACALLLGVSCFEPPVSEEVELRFLPQGNVVVTVQVKIQPPGEEKMGRPLRERIEQTRRELASGEDYWSRRLESVGPLAERVILDREEGKLSQSIHRIFLEQPDELRPLLAGAAGAVTWQEGEHWEELALFPLPGARATEEQRRRTVAALDDWSAKVARYLARVKELYGWLDEHPDRAEVCFIALFKDFVDEGIARRAEELEKEERRLVKELQDAESDLLDIFSTPEDSAWTPDELFRLVYSPFPADLRVRVPGKIVESEGFAPDGERGLLVPDVGLFGAIRSLEGRWVAPDPFVAYVEHGRRQGGKKTFDAVGFARLERKTEPAATASSVREAIENWLAAAPVYRVRWDTKGVRESAAELGDWDDPALNK